jgi:hypothetical protein
LQDRDRSLRPVLVKFSPPLGQATGQRWADLLRCEWHALQSLALHGLAAGDAATLDAGNRRFLEIPRFDRHGAAGRRGVVSLESVHTALGGSLPRSWPRAAEDLHRGGLLDDAGLDTIRRLHAFGELIGNTDMHPGNLAFRLDDSLPLQTTPAYDMLPMLWAPGQHGEIVERPFAPAPPLPADRDAWHEAAAWAECFWERVEDDSSIGAAARRQARGCRSFVHRLRQHV